MAKEKTYFEMFYGYCPACYSDELRNVGETKTGKAILICGNCGFHVLEDDVREEKDENT